MHLYHTLWCTYQLFQCVNKQMTRAYCIVTRTHVDHSHGQIVICIHKLHEAGNRWVHVYWKYTIKQYETYTLTYSITSHCIRCYSHLLVHLIQIRSYISGLKQIPHHNVICTDSTGCQHHILPIMALS